MTTKSNCNLSDHISDTNSRPNMCVKIKFLPFRFTNAITDLESKTIYLSTDINPSIIDDVMIDECSHLLSPQPGHGEGWCNTCVKSFGRVPQHNPKTDEICKEMMQFCPQNVKGCYGNVTPLYNIGNITGIQNLLLDYHLLQAYRRFSAKILGTEGSWEVSNHKIRLKPTPKGSFPVVVRYLPSIDEFHLPVAAELASRMCLAEARIMLGMARRKMIVPSPDGGTMTIDGEALVTEGREERKAIVEEAISLSEPLGFVTK